MSIQTSVRRGTVIALMGIVIAAATAGPATAATARSWNYYCSSTYHWVRVNWPTILTDTARRQAVYFRAFLYQYRRSGWKRIGYTRWYVGVSDNRQRYLLDSSFGELPYPFVGESGHYFAYYTSHGSYAGPQLGPYWTNLPSASYRVTEQYSVNGRRWSNRHPHTFCTV